MALLLVWRMNEHLFAQWGLDIFYVSLASDVPRYTIDEKNVAIVPSWEPKRAKVPSWEPKRTLKCPPGSQNAH